MKERRRSNLWTAIQIWSGGWIIITVLAVLLLLFMETKLLAQSFEEGPYPGWHADQEYQERRQADALERQLYLQQEEQRRRWYQESQERARQHDQDLRSNWGQGWDL